jgi:hypothetical protein
LLMCHVKSTTDGWSAICRLGVAFMFLIHIKNESRKDCSCCYVYLHLCYRKISQMFAPASFNSWVRHWS